MMAISGKSFCASASESFYLITRSTGQIVVSHGTVALFMVIGKFFITAVSAAIGYIIITNAN